MMMMLSLVLIMEIISVEKRLPEEVKLTLIASLRNVWFKWWSGDWLIQVVIDKPIIMTGQVWNQEKIWMRAWETSLCGALIDLCSVLVDCLVVCCE